MSEHFSENRVILLQTVAIWRSIKLCAIFSGPLCIFTALHGMQTRFYDENSVCLSVKRVHCDKTEERYVYIFIPYER